MHKPAILALASLALATSAQAARLATPAMYGGQGETQCAISYIGTGANIPVLITVKHGGGGTYQQRFTFNSTTNWGTVYGIGCPAASPAACAMSMCVFSFSAPITDFRAQGCTIDTASRKTCTDAR